MRTHVIQDRTVLPPWLEHCCEAGGPPEQTPLERFPFVIGRSEDCDLRIDSARISRRHAEIVSDKEGYRVRDLGSTNGTFLNGRQIDDAQLDDGDLLLVADLELAFHWGGPQDARDTATEVLDTQSRGGGRSRSAWELVRAVRRFEEMLAHRAVVVGYEPIVELESRRVFAHFAQGRLAASGSDDPLWEQSVLDVDCRLSSRYRRLKRMLAVEQSATLPDATAVFLRIDDLEIGDETLGRSLETLAGATPGSRSLVAVIPHRAVSDVGYFRDLFGRLQAVGIRLAYAWSDDRPPAVLSPLPLKPDYLILAESLTRDVHSNPRQQRALESIVRAGLEAQCELVATGLQRREDSEFCRRLGCRYGQGRLLDTAKQVAADACFAY